MKSINCTRVMDVSKEPIVIEIPPRSRGHFYDMLMRAYVDIGDVGPDKGRGGKYLFVNADYEGEIPEGYFEAPSEYSDRITLGYRTFPASEGSDEAAVELGKRAKWYYLSEADNPPKNSRALIGSNTYRLRVPAKAPVKQFWQIPVYEVATRSMIHTDQKKSALSSTQDLERNADGSADLYFGPEPPEGVSEKNWVRTKPGESCGSRCLGSTRRSNRS